jgi:hypothetical protein
MFAIPLLGEADEPFVKAPLVSACLIAASQQNRLAFWVERENHTPDLSLPAKAKLFHVGVLRTLEGIDSGPTEVGTKFPQQECMSKKLILQALWHLLKLRIKFTTKYN